MRAKHLVHLLALLFVILSAGATTAPSPNAFSYHHDDVLGTRST